MNRRKSLVKEDSVGNINFDHDAAERASFDHGITNRSIFTGGMQSNEYHITLFSYSIVSDISVSWCCDYV